MKSNIFATYKIEELFTIENCKCSNISKVKMGNTPYVGATNRNNGIIKFVENDLSLITRGKCIAFICDGEGAVGYSVYKNENFVGSTTVKAGRNDNVNLLSGLFITTIADQVRSKYNFGFKRNDKHLKAEKLLLPTTYEGSPDYEYMENYSKTLFKTKEQEYLTYIGKRLNELKNVSQPIALEKKEWKGFLIGDLFENIKGDQNNMSSLKVGNVPLISAKKIDNGLKGFCQKNINKKIYSKNTITLNLDGDGGAGIAYYQPFQFILDSHVTNLIPNNKSLSKYSLLFITKSITVQRGKFGNGYPINEKRLKRLKIMLPINSVCTPDYEYMEQYMQYQEVTKLKEYLTFKQSI